MKAQLRLYNADGFQDDGAYMPVSFIEAEIASDDGEFVYTLGRLFFPPEIMDKLLGESGLIQTRLVDDREGSGNVRITTA